MADAEESPSSLADLEALAGLAEPSSAAGDDLANEPDPSDFDLASLAASAGVGARETESVVSQGDPHGALAEPTAPTASPNASPGAARGSSGFVLGLIAGVTVAGVLFLALRDTTESTGASPAPTNPAALVATSPEASSASSPSAAVVAAAPSPAPALPVQAVEAPKADRPVNARPAVTASAKAVASVQAPADEDPNADPTRPPSPAAPAAASEPSAPSRPIDSLLDDALGSGKPAKRANPDALMGADLPLTPTAADVTKAIQVLLPAIRGCAMGQSGVANTLLVVRSDGGVASVSVTGAPYAGAASGRCMEGVLRRAKFARFQQSVFRVQFPLSIRANAP